MIWTILILWLLLGFAGAIHWPYALRRSLAREHPLLFSEDEPLVDFYYKEFWFVAILMSAVGPLCFLVTYLTCPEGFFK